MASKGGESSRRFQNSNTINGNFKDSGRHGGRQQQQGENKKGRPSTKTGDRLSSKGSGEKILNDFIWANTDLVDKSVIDRLRIGDKLAISEALNMIHYRSLQLKKVRGSEKEFVRGDT